MILGGLGVIADLCIKQAGRTTAQVDYRYFIPALLIYVTSAIGWLWAMRNIKLATVGIIYALTTMLLLTASGVVLYRERLNNWEMAAVVTAVVSLAVLSRFAGQ